MLKENVANKHLKSIVIQMLKTQPAQTAYDSTLRWTCDYGLGHRMIFWMWFEWVEGNFGDVFAGKNQTSIAISLNM